MLQKMLEEVKARDKMLGEEDRDRRREMFSEEWAKTQVIIIIEGFSSKQYPQPHHLYDVHVVMKGISEWTIKRRYSHFREELYNKRPPGNPSLPSFPGRSLWNDAAVAEARQPDLERFLQEYVNCFVASEDLSPLLKTDPKETLIQLVPFLSPESFQDDEY